MAACLHAADLRPFEAVEPHMGTLARIKLYAADEAQASAAFRAAFDRIRRLDEALSDYNPDSELNRICRNASGRSVPASLDLFTVLLASQTLAESTDGAFDVTLGPVVRLWRKARRAGRPPDGAALRAALSRCGYRKLHLDAANRTVRLDDAGMQLDLGGIGKGYAADAALAALRDMGIRSALVALSGDLAFSDAPPGQRGWRIGIDSLDAAASDFTRVLELSNAAVSTSSDSEQHLDAGGERYSHILDPATGAALTRSLAVTIVADRGILADATATAVSVLGVERGMRYIEQHPDLAALIVTRTGGAFHVTESLRFERLCAAQRTH
ncbi:MAG TPA: FAD:protein FMN transferase [Bryobacteraceae bacterium]|nr:FAD:protein FMN transferase [Bryobacteraceae bacterium]